LAVHHRGWWHTIHGDHIPDHKHHLQFGLWRWQCYLTGKFIGDGSGCVLEHITKPDDSEQ
jgi:hypothetical protein